ncbi:MAG: chondroitinase-B domain-containing protein, partial [Patescibacteria group bacterium]
GGGPYVVVYYTTGGTVVEPTSGATTPSANPTISPTRGATNSSPSPTRSLNPTSSITSPTPTRGKWRWPTRIPSGTSVNPTTSQNQNNDSSTDKPYVIVDDFNREDDDIWETWGGSVTGNVVRDNELKIGGFAHAFWEKDKFGADQTPFFTIKKIGTVSDKTEFGVIAKSQSNKGNNNLVYVAYFPQSKKLQISTTTNYQTQLLSEKQNVTFAAGDMLSMRVDMMGNVTIRKNTEVVQTYSLAGKWPYFNKDGWVGIYTKNASDVYIDDFGVVNESGGVVNVTPTIGVGSVTPTKIVSGATVTPTKPAANATSGLTPTKAITSAPTAAATATKAPTPTQGQSGPTPTRAPISAKIYWLGLNGNDRNDGKSNQTPIKSFAHAWDLLMPGDTLMIMNGTYTEPIQPNVRDGQQGAPITIKAAEDGKVIIDGRGEEIPIRFGENWGPNGNMGKSWYVLEGIVAINGTIANIRAEHASNIVMRRVSAYNASTDDNSQAIALVWSNNILVEDAIAGGTGRYMTQNFDGDNVTYRRVFTMWQRWDGRRFCGVSWPNGNNMGIYNSSNSTIENGIAYGRSQTGIFIQANDDAAISNNNQVIGSMSLLQGKNYDNTVWKYGSSSTQPTSRPGPITNPWGDPCPDNITQWWWGGHRVAFTLYGQGELQNNVFKDIIGLDSMGVGLQFLEPYGAGKKSNNSVEYVTLLNNGQDIESWEADGGGNIDIGFEGVNNPTNSKIAGSNWANGTGARMEYRYENRQLTNTPLLPWPMEQRGLTEMGLSIESVINAGKARANGQNVTYPVPQGGTLLKKD